MCVCVCVCWGVGGVGGGVEVHRRLEKRHATGETYICFAAASPNAPEYCKC